MMAKSSAHSARQTKATRTPDRQPGEKGLDFERQGFDIGRDEEPRQRQERMRTDSGTDSLHCPYCGAEPIDDDDLCRFCGKVMSSPGRTMRGTDLLASLLCGVKAKIRPLTEKECIEMDEENTFNLSNPADPIWDDSRWGERQSLLSCPQDDD